MIHLIASFVIFLLSFIFPVVKPVSQSTIKHMQIISPAFTNNSTLPKKYTCNGEGVNPPLVFSEVPVSAVSLVLIVTDPDAPGGAFTHWVLFNIPSSTRDIAENSYPIGSVQSATSTGKEGYVAACPPPGTGIHHYQFKLSALDTVLVLTPNMKVGDVEGAMQGHIIASSQLVGLYPEK